MTHIDPILTAADVMALRPCDDWPAERVKAFAAKRGGSMSLLAMLRATSISAEDRIWLACAVLARRDRPLMLRFCYMTAERACRVHAAKALDAAGLTEPAEALRAVRISDEGSAWAAAWAARDAAWDARAAGAAGDAAGDAARAARAAGDAARDAAGDAARAARDAAGDAARAARDAARDAEQKQQLRDLRALIGAAK